MGNKEENAKFLRDQFMMYPPQGREALSVKWALKLRTIFVGVVLW